MKLLELLDTKVTDRKVSGEFDQDKLSQERYKKLRTDKDNVGAYGYVKQSGDPFTINKRPHDAGELNDDGYFVYIKNIVDDKMYESNPYFPRVYDIKTFTDKNDKSRYSIKLEKLIELNNVSDDELYSMLNKVFNNVDGLIAHIKTIKHNISNNRELYDAVIKHGMKSIENIKDKKLIEALSFIHKIKKLYNFNWDVRSKNIMVRRGPYGIQLVITDPLS